MKMYAPGEEVWFDTIGVHCIPEWRTKQKYYHGRVLRPEMNASKHGYNYWVDIGFGESVLVHDWNILTRTPYYDDDFIKAVREEYKEESEKIKDDIIDKLDVIVNGQRTGKMTYSLYQQIKAAEEKGDMFKLGIKDWCKESNHVFEVGEFAKILKEDSMFYGWIVKIVDVRYDTKQDRHRYWVACWPNDMLPLEYKQNELELTNGKPKCWEEKEMENTNVNFTKNMLKSGMLVITRDGTRYIIMRDANGYNNFVNRNKVISFVVYNDDLTKIDRNNHKDDIVKVYGLQKQMQVMDDIFKTDTRIPIIFGGSYPNRDLVWERSEAKEMTMAEIEKALGYKVKVVK